MAFLFQAKSAANCANERKPASEKEKRKTQGIFRQISNLFLAL
jgi:hypothetical protein